MEHFCGGGYPLQRICALFSMNAIRDDMMAFAWLKRMLVLAVIGCATAPALAQNCGMDEAQNHYDNMRLNEAIRLLEDCRREDRWYASRPSLGPCCLR